MTFDHQIFKEYDIRGIYPQQINKDIAFKIGQAATVYFKVKKVAVGRDMRLSSPELFQALVSGILDQGANVVDIGLISTDMLWFASGKYNFPLSIMVTASHNPADWNGFKMAQAGANAVSGSTGFYAIRNLLFTTQNFKQSLIPGSITKQDLLEDWVNHALSLVVKNIVKKIKVVVDAGNGMGGEATKICLEKLGAQIIPLFFEHDGSFPNRGPDPTKDENVLKLKSTIIHGKADFGVAFDPDADRIAFFDENGERLSGTIITALLAKVFLERNPKDLVLYNAIIGKAVPELVQKIGGKSLRVRVGHSLIKPKMRELNAVFAGESSYHFFFRDNYYADSGLIALLLFFEAISKDGRKVSEIVKEFDRYVQSGELNFKVEDKRQVLKDMKDRFPDAQNYDLLDGLSLWFQDWWFNLRSSNTENLVRLNIEANDKYILDNKVKTLLNYIKSLGGVQI